MSDLIRRSAALEDAELIDWYHINQNGRLVSGSSSEDVSYVKFNDVISILKNAPAVDAVPVVHARWKDHHCSSCYAVCPTCKSPNGFVMRIETPYCPHCGAKMDGE